MTDPSNAIPQHEIENENEKFNKREREKKRQPKEKTPATNSLIEVIDLTKDESEAEESVAAEDWNSNGPNNSTHALREPGQRGSEQRRDEDQENEDDFGARLFQILRGTHQLQINLAAQKVVSAEGLTAGPSSAQSESHPWPRLGYFKWPRLGANKCSRCLRMSLRCEPQLG